MTPAGTQQEKLPPQNKDRRGDIESGEGGERRLYPTMVEDPMLRWAFIRKVYTILSLQLFLTVAVASCVVFIPGIADCMRGTVTGKVIFVCVIILPIIFILVLSCYRRRHPFNFLLLVAITVLIAFAIGITCAYKPGKVILEAAVLTLVVVISLTLYTFWAAKKGHDFQFLGPFLFAATMVLLLFLLIQLLWPLGRWGVMIYGCAGAIIFSGHIIYDTDNLIKRFEYDDYIWASISLYLDIVNLFLALLTIFGIGSN